MKIRQIIHVSLMLSLSMMVSYPYCQVNDTLETAGPTNNNGFIACSNELRIKEFSGSKTFKVVVSQTKSFPIEVFGLDFFLSPPYKWELGNFPVGSFKWELRPVNLLQGKTEIKIDAVNNTNMPKSNDYFGDKYGVVKLSDHNGNFTISTEPYLNKRVQVFFEKDALNPSNPDEPNWFYYWKQFVDNKLISELIFHKDITSKCPATIHACTGIHSKISYIGQKCSENILFLNSGLSGISTLITVFAHENQHIVIYNRFWPNGYTGYLDLDGDGILDDENSDGYPNWFETSEIGKKYEFRLNNINDKFGEKEVWDDGSYKFSSGTVYEEKECNNVALGINSNIYFYLDWSIDINNLFHGKNW